MGLGHDRVRCRRCHRGATVAWRPGLVWSDSLRWLRECTAGVVCAQCALGLALARGRDDVNYYTRSHSQDLTFNSTQLLLYAYAIC